MSDNRNVVPVLIARDQMDEIRRIQEAERQCSVNGTCSGVNAVIRDLIRTALELRKQEGKKQ